MSEVERQADDLLLKAITKISKARVLVKKSKSESAEYFFDAIDLFNEAILTNPNDFENRIVRARHIFEASIDSPFSFMGVVEEDIKFLDSNYNTLNDRGKSRFNNLKGEYLIHKGEIEKGKDLLRISASLSPDSILGDYAKKLLEIL